MALAVAARVGAAEEVKQVVFEAHRGAVSEKGLWDVIVSGERAVRSVLEARPEVSMAGCMCFAVCVCVVLCGGERGDVACRAVS